MDTRQQTKPYSSPTVAAILLALTVPPMQLDQLLLVMDAANEGHLQMNYAQWNK